MAPHLGHLPLLTAIAAYVAAFGPGITLTLAGGPDGSLRNDARHIDRQIAALGLKNNVRIVRSADAGTLEGLLADADVFLCLSGHEGYCSPILKAQASGVPVISIATPALGETIGPGQLVVDPPNAAADFLLVARLIHQVCTNGALRRQVIAAGHRNVLNRFTPEIVADRFMEALAPLFDPAT
jgi:glycosyltransferase involved in cell wall biosynthesis